MTVSIFPTNEDVGGGDEGRTLTEIGLKGLFSGMFRRNFITAGLNTTGDAGLVVTVAAGEAFISGYHYDESASQTVTVNANETDAHWFKALTKNADGFVTGSSWARVINPAIDGSDDPVDSVEVFKVTTGASTVTTRTDIASHKKDVVVGEYSGDGTGLQTVALGFLPALVIVAGPNGLRSGIFSMSHIFLLGGVSTSQGLFADVSGNKGVEFDNKFRPTLVGGATPGFEVGTDGVRDNLNMSGQVYSYVAFPR